MWKCLFQQAYRIKDNKDKQTSQPYKLMGYGTGGFFEEDHPAADVNQGFSDWKGAETAELCSHGGVQGKGSKRIKVG